MSFDWAEYQLLAERLRHEEGEAERRSALSRVYYSVFCRARNYLADTGFVVSAMGSGSHQQVWNEFRMRGRTHNPIGLKGKSLHHNRIKADYEEKVENLDKLVDESFRTAEEILYYLKQVRNASNE